MKNNEMISVKIEVSSIPEDRFFKTESGKIYLDIVLNERRDSVPDQYGNTMTVKLAKREGDTEPMYCGSAKLITFEAKEGAKVTKDDLPF